MIDMDALTQYLELFRTNKELVDNHSCEPMNKLRATALKVLEEKGLPVGGSENYELTDLNNILAPDFGLNLARIEIDANPRASFHCGVPSMSAIVRFQINDIFYPENPQQPKLPEGVIIDSLVNFYKKYPGEVESIYGRIADIGNPLVALNSLLVQDGIVVWVRKGVKCEIPVQFVNILHNGMPLMAVRRLLICLEEDAEIKIVSCDHTQVENTSFSILQTIEINVGRNSRLDFYELEESSIETSRLSSLYLHQEEGSEVVIDGITLYNGKTRNEYFCKFKGERARLNLSGLAIEDKDRLIDTYSCISHDLGYCVSEEMFKYVVDEKARGAFAGLIKVENGAVKTEAYQSNRNIVGSEDARVFSKPQLEIYDDDVKCSHGCTVGQLDEKQIFYMQTRGIPESEARFLLKQAFMADIVEKISLPSLRDRLKSLIEKRFSGEVFNCSGCGYDCSDLKNNKS